jgi:integral membrane protein (TIGR01906 family)
VNTFAGRATSVVIGVATAILIISVSIVPFLTSAWVDFEQDRAQAQAWTGYSTEAMRTATGAILQDLITGPPDFDVEVAGAPVLEERERTHMRDVRSVFLVLLRLAVVAGVILLVAGLRVQDRGRLWRAVRRGATVLAVGVVALGAVALVAFDSLFETFHEVFFPAGSYTFDPRTDRLVQLFPFQFWQETAIVVGIVVIALSIAVAFVAHRREHRPASTVATDPATAATAPG